MNGFFTAKETASVSRPDGKAVSCVSCGLSIGASHPKLKPFGNFKKGILNIGISPSQKDDNLGKPWQDSAGLLLSKVYQQAGIDLFEDCLNIYAIRCPVTDKITPHQLQSCHRYLLDVIEKYKPNVIVTLGWEPVVSLLSNRWKKELGTIEKWRGWNIPDQDFGCWICPVYHPEYVLDSKKKEIETVWKLDIERALGMTYVPWKKDKPCTIEILEDLSELKRISSENIAFDYETTGIKPHAKGHRIVCASVADSEDHCYVFMMPDSKSGRKPFIDLLKNPGIGKMAHNMKFEETWSLIRLKQPIQNWQWDSMQAAHILDNRVGVTSLKFQTYVNFGVVDYASEVSPYLASKEEGGNAINRVLEMILIPELKKKLLTYCAMDSIYQYRLAMLQTKKFNYNFLPF